MFFTRWIFSFIVVCLSASSWAAPLCGGVFSFDHMAKPAVIAERLGNSFSGKLMPKDHLWERATVGDRRQLIFFEHNTGWVEIQPHALILFAEVAASSFMLHQLKYPKLAADHPILTSRVFLDPVERVSYWEDLMKLSDQEHTDLVRVGELLGEGDYQLTAEELKMWFLAAVERVTHEQGPSRVVTPQIIDQTLRELIASGRFGHREPAHWEQLLQYLDQLSRWSSSPSWPPLTPVHNPPS